MKKILKLIAISVIVVYCIFAIMAMSTFVLIYCF